MSFSLIYIWASSEKYTVKINSEGLFQPQNAKLALRPLELIRLTVELLIGTAHGGTHAVWPINGAGPAPVNRTIMALVRRAKLAPKMVLVLLHLGAKTDLLNLHPRLFLKCYVFKRERCLLVRSQKLGNSI